MGFIQKPDIIQEFLVIVDQLRKPLAHGYLFFPIGLGHLVLDLDPVEIKFQILNENSPGRRYKDSKFLAPPSQRSGWTLADFCTLLTSLDIRIVINDPDDEKTDAL